MNDLHAAFVAGARWWYMIATIDPLLPVMVIDNLPADITRAAESHYPDGHPIPNELLLGTWPADDPRRAFVAGAEWMEFHATSFTMWGSDRRSAEEEAMRRYPDLGGATHE